MIGSPRLTTHPPKPEVLLLRDVVAELENLLRRALGERIELETIFSESKLWVEMDPAQLEQVLVNLAVNARDAMPDGGRLVIEVEPAELDAEYARMHPETEPGSYLRLKVSDTGEGGELLRTVRDLLDRGAAEG